MSCQKQALFTTFCAFEFAKKTFENERKPKFINLIAEIFMILFSCFSQNFSPEKNARLKELSFYFRMKRTCTTLRKTLSTLMD